MILLIDNYDSFSYNLYQLVGKKIPTLGVCLGHQAICAAYGANVTYAKKLMHGKQSFISFKGNSPIFREIGEGAPVARYHSLAAAADTIPECLEVTAVADDGEIMAVQHKEYPIYGVQFHPESIMTPVVSEIMSGATTPTQNAAFLAALSTKSTKAETIDEITGCAAAMREAATRFENDLDLLEIVGTGGDNAHSFNISTTSAFVIAASGVLVAKHGNRAASSLSGTADCLEALGANISLEPEKCHELLDKVGFCFFFAQKYHASMKYVGPIRKELGIRTVFNILGPLTNPAYPKFHLLGVYDRLLLMKLGSKRGMVVYGTDKLDEISLSAPTAVCEYKDGWMKNYEITPEQFGFERCTKDDLLGGTPQENAAITRGILSGEIQGHKRNAVLLNAGAAIYIGGKADSMADGIKLAAELIDSGKALAVLDKFVELSH